MSGSQIEFLLLYILLRMFNMHTAMASAHQYVLPHRIRRF